MSQRDDAPESANNSTGAREDSTVNAPRQRALRVLVPFEANLSARAWRVRNAADEVPDATPYGLHKMERHGVTPEFAERNLSRPTKFLGKVARRASGGLYVVEALKDARDHRSRSTDLIFCYDERNGIPAALARNANRPPVISGLHFLDEPARLPRALRAAAAKAVPRFAACFTHTATMAEVMKSEWSVPAERITVVPFGIDTDFYNVQPPPEMPGVVMSAGEDVLRDHALLIAAVSKVKERNKSTSLELASGLRADMPAGLGRIHTERLYGRMRDLYRRASVVAIAVHPSGSRASGSTVVLEGMASGRPVVATANPALAEFIKDGVTGILVPPGDVDAMAKAIADLLADPDRAAEMGRAGAKYVRENFTSDIMAKKLADIALSI